MSERTKGDALRVAAAIAVAVSILVAIFVIWPRWTTYWLTSDKINFFVAVGTLALAATTVLLARYTLQSVRASAKVIAAEDLRHEQSLAPILSASLVIDAEKREATGIKVTNAGLGPALQIGITGNVQYERRQEKDDDSFAVVETKTFEMMNCMGAVVGAQSFAILPTGAPPGWILSGIYLAASNVKITYRDVFGTFYQSVGVDLYHGYFYWEPDSGIFSPKRRDAALSDYLSKKKKES